MARQNSIQWLYRRYSSKPQERGDSIRRQNALAAGYEKRSGVGLDRSLPIDDGVSAFKGLNREQGSLGRFLEMIEDGRVQPGDVLVAENLDRLSRENPWDSIPLLCSICNAGVKIQSLSPEMLYERGEDIAPLILGVVELFRSNGESSRKSSLVGKAWANKRDKARAGGTLMTGAMPPWLRPVGEGDARRAEVIPEKAAVVKLIFDKAVNGRGAVQIAKDLTDAGVPPLPRPGKGGKKPRGMKWARSTVRRVLTDRSVLGEFQPMKGHGSRTVKDGEPLPGYFPAVVDLATFHAAQSAMTSRKNPQRGRRRSSRFNNPFQGLLKDARTKLSYITAVRQNHRMQRHYVLKAAEGTASSFPFDIFEKAVLSCLKEVKPEEVTSGFSPGELRGLEGERDAVAENVAAIAADLGRKFSPALRQVLDGAESRLAELQAAVGEMERKVITPASASLREAQALLAAYLSAPDKDEACARLRAALRRCLDSVWVLVTGRGHERFAEVQLNFRDSDRVRHVAVYVRPPRGNGTVVKPGLWWAATPLWGESRDLMSWEDLPKLTKERAEREAAGLPDRIGAWVSRWREDPEGSNGFMRVVSGEVAPS